MIWARFRVLLVSSQKEKKEAFDFRQKHFFDQRGLKDPYAWILDAKHLAQKKMLDRLTLTSF